MLGLGPQPWNLLQERKHVNEQRNRQSLSRGLSTGRASGDPEFPEFCAVFCVYDPDVS